MQGVLGDDAGCFHATGAPLPQTRLAGGSSQSPFLGQRPRRCISPSFLPQPAPPPFQSPLPTLLSAPKPGARLPLPPRLSLRYTLLRTVELENGERPLLLPRAGISPERPPRPFRGHSARRTAGASRARGSVLLFPVACSLSISPYVLLSASVLSRTDETVTRGIAGGGLGQTCLSDSGGLWVCRPALSSTGSVFSKFLCADSSRAPGGLSWDGGRVNTGRSKDGEGSRACQGVPLDHPRLERLFLGASLTGTESSCRPGCLLSALHVLTFISDTRGHAHSQQGTFITNPLCVVACVHHSRVAACASHSSFLGNWYREEEDAQGQALGACAVWRGPGLWGTVPP